MEVFKMKNKSFFLLSALLGSGIILASCSSSVKDTIEVYKDISKAKIDNLVVEFDRIESNPNYSTIAKGFNSKIYLRFTNSGSSEIKLDVKDSFITCENDNSSSNAKVTLGKESLSEKENASIGYSITTSTPLSENSYSLSTTINDVIYKVHLYDMPDSERQDFKVDYKIGDQVVNSITVKEGKLIGKDYVYENPNHLTYCDVWNTSDGDPIGSNTKVNSNLVVSGVEKSNIYFASQDDKYVATSIDYIPSDKVVVVPNSYSSSAVTEIAESFFFSKQVKTIYLPKSIQKIDENNFYACTILETINYEGTEAEWNAINNLSKDNILDSVTINFEAKFGA